MAVFATPVSLNLPRVPEKYSPEFQQQVIDYLESLQRGAYLKQNHVEIYTPGDAGGRERFLILRSPNGTRWKITVDNAGSISATDVGSLGL